MPLLFLVFFLRTLSEPGCVYEKTMAEQGLVEVQQAIPGILVQLKYATSDNFMHKNVYGCLQKAYLQKEVVARLKKAQDYLSANHPGYHFLIYDATRPLAKQWDLWNALPQYPPKLRSNYVANPAEHSIHNYGSAVDLTVADEQGRPLAMGTPFDFFGEMAYPSREKALLASGKLTKEAYQNRLILRQAMVHGGFMPIQYEWWHFNAFSRAEAKRRFAVLK
jgi:D-alanyl-D-alanine dipeptidase